MFGLGRNRAHQIEQVAGVVRGAAGMLQKAIATTAALRRTQPPEPDERYFAVLLGFADFVGQANDADVATTKEGLKSYLASYSDGAEMFQYMMEIADDPQSFEWQELGGQALQESTNGGDPTAAMMRLASKFF